MTSVPVAAHAICEVAVTAAPVAACEGYHVIGARVIRMIAVMVASTAA